MDSNDFQVTGTLGDCISHVTYMNKLGKPVKWDLYVMSEVKEYDWWPESEMRSRIWVREEDIDKVNISSLTKSHIDSILEYLHTHYYCF